MLIDSTLSVGFFFGFLCKFLWERCDSAPDVGSPVNRFAIEDLLESSAVSSYLWPVAGSANST